MKKILLFLCMVSLNVSALDAASVATNVGNVQGASSYSAPSGYEPKGYVGSILSQIFSPVGKILSDYVLAFQSILTTDNTVPVWNASTKVFDVGTITDTGTNVGIGVTSPGEKLTVSGRLSITGNPNSDDDVGDRLYNDGRYVNVGESIDGDTIQDGTIDSSEIENNSLSSADLAANSVGNSELNNSETFSMAGFNLNGKAKMIQGGSYDLWIQGGSTDTGGNNRNLAFLGQKSNDQLRINYGGEYTGGTRFDGNVGIGISNPTIKLHIGAGSDVGPSTGGYVQFGGTNSNNLAIDNNEIAARNNGVGSNLYIQAITGAGDTIMNGGSGNVGIGTSPGNLYKLDVDGKIRMRGGTEATDGNNIVATKGYVDSYSPNIGQFANSTRNSTITFTGGSWDLCALTTVRIDDGKGGGAHGAEGCYLTKNASNWTLRNSETEDCQAICVKF